MAERLDPWGSGKIEDYENLFREFGIESFEKFRNKLSENRYVRRRIIFGHRDFGRIMNSIDDKKPFAMMTGLMPSGKFHFGHKMVADQIVWYQNLGAEIYICAADMESYLMRGISFEIAKNIAIEEYLTNYVALGLSEKNLHFYFQSDYVTSYYRFRDSIARKVTLNQLSGIYGQLEPNKVISALTQVADILHPQLKEFGGPRPVVVPVGVDQDPHLRLTRDLAMRFQNEFKFITPASTYHKFMEGLQGGKMSSSDPNSYIALTEKPEDARRKIMSAKTGGRATIAEQREKGGIPEECTVYDFFLYHLVDDDKELEKIYTDCKAGKRVCGECKKICADMVVKFLEEHQEKREKAREIAKKILGK